MYGQFDDGSITSKSNFIRATTLGDNAEHDTVITGNWLLLDFVVSTRASTTGKNRIIDNIIPLDQ